MLADSFREKDQEYSEIGNRVQQIEDLMGLSEMPREDAELTSQVDLSSLTASHEKILYDTIPNGFPTKANIITNEFGGRIHPVTTIKTLHKGVDLHAEVGNRVISTADGIVRETGYSELSGRRVVIQHNLGFKTRYSHLDQIDVKPGDIVHKGDLIGLTGDRPCRCAPSAL